VNDAYPDDFPGYQEYAEIFLFIILPSYKYAIILYLTPLFLRGNADKTNTSVNKTDAFSLNTHVEGKGILPVLFNPSIPDFGYRNPTLQEVQWHIKCSATIN